MKWLLLILFAGSAQVLPVDGGKPACEELRSAILAAYGKGTALIDVKCIPTQDNGGPRK